MTNGRQAHGNGETVDSGPDGDEGEARRLAKGGDGGERVDQASLGETFSGSGQAISLESEEWHYGYDSADVARRGAIDRRHFRKSCDPTEQLGGAVLNS